MTKPTTTQEQIRKALVKVYAHGYHDCLSGLKIEGIDEAHRLEADKHVDEIMKILTTVIETTRKETAREILEIIDNQTITIDSVRWGNQTVISMVAKVDIRDKYLTESEK